MSLSEILGAAVSGLNAAQAGLKTVSTNIANVGTPGYARERVNQSTAVTADRISGVTVGEPIRIADKFLEAAVYRRATDLGVSEVQANYLDRMQALLGAPDSESGLPSRLDAINSAAIAMTGALGAEQNAADFIARAADAIGTIQRLDTDIAMLSADADAEIGMSVERINALLTQIHKLNDTVSRLDGLGRSSAGTVDQRNMAVEELSGMLGVVAREQPNGRIMIETSSGAPLLDGRLRLLSYPSSKSGTGAALADYPGIDIRFANERGEMGAATGDRIESSAVGGKLGGLIDLRDRTMPGFREQLGTLFTGLARALNGASNASSSVPAPARLYGSTTALATSDRLGFTGASYFAVTAADGTVVAQTRVDFDALGAGATVNDALTAINAGLGGAGTATFANGRLVIEASGAGRGVVVADDATAPSNRGGVGFSQYFGLNDMVRAEGALTVPAGFAPGDAHGFDTGSTADLMLRDASGRVIARATMAPVGGGTMGDLVTQLNTSPLGTYGSFSIDGAGRFRFDQAPGVTGTVLSIPADSTNRHATGISFSALAGLTGSTNALAAGQVAPELRNTPSRLPLAIFDPSAGVGNRGLLATDTRAAQFYTDSFSKVADLGKDGNVSLERYASLILGEAGTTAANAQSRLEDATARKQDATNRRDSFSGVNIDEELAQMIVLQNSYSAAARVVSVAGEMYDTLIGMMN
ncbi:flagellar biosynthesis protein FlgK [Sphingomonas suaedae]|uniref:Flagellar hook-associated protein 1 n=1 Tax=Sphingomonas suaedae TaxID=2599297 RepID=A0A518RE92_9SPHN|nr:flagellar basal body rod C-terminal domain-containing protein [Sphingomonas suaedae]QDX25763.1 flagellar biosynthesis protein FlgK [Sphingomonas suaedae]